MIKDTKEVYFKQIEDVGYIIINSPPANKISSVFLESLYYILNEISQIKTLRGIIVTGTGRHFSSGTDVEELKKGIVNECRIDEQGKIVAYPTMKEYRQALDLLYGLKIPVISAIGGFCIGSGFEVALNTHIRICDKGSVIGSPEVTFGVMPGLGGTLRYAELCGIGSALEIVLRGETFLVEEGQEVGIVDKIVRKKQSLEYSEKLLRYIIENVKDYDSSQVSKYIEAFDSKFGDDK